MNQMEPFNLLDFVNFRLVFLFVHFVNWKQKNLLFV